VLNTAIFVCATIADEQARGDGGDDATHVEVVFCEQERAVGEDERENDFGHVLVEIHHHAEDGVARREAHHEAAEAGDENIHANGGEFRGREQRGRVGAGFDDDGEQCGEDDDADPVVQQALAFDEDGESPGRAEFFEQREHRDGVSWKDGCGKEEGDEQREPEGELPSEAEDEHGDDEAGHGEDENRDDVRAKSRKVGRRGPFEQQGREENEQNDVVREFEANLDVEDGDGESGEEERNGVRKAPHFRDEHAHARREDEHGEQGEEAGFDSGSSHCRVFSRQCVNLGGRVRAVEHSRSAAVRRSQVFILRQS
jgi:hypothetical protein